MKSNKEVFSKVTSRANAYQPVQLQSLSSIIDNRPEIIKQRKLQALIDCNNKKKPTICKDFSQMKEKNKSYNQQEILLSSLDNKIIQKKGVKKFLIEANELFKEFVDETKNIHTLRDKVASSIYNSYKPNTLDPKQHYTDKTDRDIDDGDLKHSLAYRKAEGLKHWSSTAAVSAKRIYAELIEAMKLAKDNKLEYSCLTAGMNTKTEPDFFVVNTKKNFSIPLEVKHICTDDYSAIDTHVAKASQQLDKRDKNATEPSKKRKRVDEKTSSIVIDNENNSWPYTVGEYNKLTKRPTHKAVGKKAKARIKRHKNSKDIITFNVKSKNPWIGDMEITI